MCTCYMWMSQVVARVVEPAMERVPKIVMVAIVCQSLNPSQKQVHMRYVSPPIHGEWHETLHARSPDPSALFFARRVWLARLAFCHDEMVSYSMEHTSFKNNTSTLAHHWRNNTSSVLAQQRLNSRLNKIP